MVVKENLDRKINYSLPNKMKKAYGFDNANKILKPTTASRFANFSGSVSNGSMWRKPLQKKTFKLTGY